MPNRHQISGEMHERFYQSVAETLALLHAGSGRDRRQALLEVSNILAITMDLPLVWIGQHAPDQSGVMVLAAAGTAAGYASTLRLSNDERVPEGRGPVGTALRDGRAKWMPVDATDFAPWQEAARQYGLGACIVAVSATRDDGQLVLVAYSRSSGPALDEGLLDWAQRLADELSRYWDHQALLERSARMSRYRDAQRAIQRALLEQPDPDAIYRTLAEALVEIAGAAAVDVFAADDDDDMLRRVALIGPIADIVRALPIPPRREVGALVKAPTLAFMRGLPVVRRNPSRGGKADDAWRPELLQYAGAVGCWPLSTMSAGALDAPHTPVGVFVVLTTEPDAFDEELRRLLDEVADAAGLALGQHAQRVALVQERERQTYLALHDALTGLPNRRALDRHLDAMLIRADTRQQIAAVGLLDLDDLKPINDRHGHAIGDRILVEVASRLRQVVRSRDYVARLGGDEFVLVFEQIEQEADLDELLDRIGASLQQPHMIDGRTFAITASLGIAVHSHEPHANGDQLLRRADQAMYRAKASKRQRSRWWVKALSDGATEPAVAVEATSPDGSFLYGNVSPYGEHAIPLLAACAQSWTPLLDGVVDDFHEGLQLHEGFAALLSALPAKEVSAFKSHVLQHLHILMSGDLNLPGHHARAARSGLFHAACGIEEVWLLEAIDQLRDILACTLGAPNHAHRSALAILLQRLGMERQWQIESMRELQRRRVSILARLNALAWSAEGYLELIQGVVDILVSHKEIISCAAGRPDASGHLVYEAVAGSAFTEYLRALGMGKAQPIRVEGGTPDSDGPSGRAWRKAQIQRCAHYGSDPAMAAWRDIALSLKVVSNVAIPLCPSPLQPAAVLTLYSPYAGGFQSEDQQAFVGQIKTVLDLALARLAPPRQGAELLPFFVRERWRAMVGSEALQMHYQPLVRLADGRVTELEALARLHNDDGDLLGPARFLPALGADDLIVLFRQGLIQATACRESLLHMGHVLDMSVNVPAAALEDPRYAEVAAAVMASSGCQPRSLLFEVLESPIGTEHATLMEGPGMQSLKALGVRLVEDDLGSGYSSLIRLRQWPFDRIKIDQVIVTQVRQDPLGTLRFIRQLIRIGRDLQLEVVVEGLESPGLIEAAMVLGADFGQGYALARPMPKEALPAWLSNYEPAGRGPTLRTCLGALATELRWEEQFTALPADPTFWAQHAQAYGDATDASVNGVALGPSHEAMLTAALAGPSDPDYCRAREQFLSSLIERVLTEERSSIDTLRSPALDGTLQLPDLNFAE